MSRYLRRFCFSCIALLVATPLAATERSHVATVKFVYPVADGDFVIGLDSDSPYCTSTSLPNKYYHVYVGQFGVNAAGSSKMYAAAMLALSTRLNLTVVFDDATASCYVNRLTVTN
jgi:hypothetical protein